MNTSPIVINSFSEFERIPARYQTMFYKLATLQLMIMAGAMQADQELVLPVLEQATTDFMEESEPMNYTLSQSFLQEYSAYVIKQIVTSLYDLPVWS